MSEDPIKIIKCGSKDSWSILSDYEGGDFTVLERNVELRAHYIVDITDKILSVQRKFSLVHVYTEDGELHEDEPLWEGTQLDDGVLIGFDILDFESKATRGRISGVKVMNIHHYLPVDIYVVYNDTTE